MDLENQVEDKYSTASEKYSTARDFIFKRQTDN